MTLPCRQPTSIAHARPMSGRSRTLIYPFVRLLGPCLRHSRSSLCHLEAEIWSREVSTRYLLLHCHGLWSAPRRRVIYPSCIHRYFLTFNWCSLSHPIQQSLPVDIFHLRPLLSKYHDDHGRQSRRTTLQSPAPLPCEAFRIPSITRAGGLVPITVSDMVAW